MSELWRRFKWFLNRERYEREMEDEIRFHLALKAMDHDSASAHRQFGNITLVREDSRRMWTGTFFEQLAQDIRYGIRAMSANKLFSAMAILSLALGIGANTAIYSFMDAIMIKAMPVQHPQDLMIVNWHVKGDDSGVVHNHSGSSYDQPGGLTTSPNFPFAAYEFLRDNNKSMSRLFAYANAGRLNLVIDGQAELGGGEFVSGGYFGGLGVVPAAGRLIGPDDDRPGATPVVAITYGFWQRRFGGSPGAIGKSILLNGKPFTIAGVTAPEFFGVRPQSSTSIFIPVRQLPLVDLNRFGDAPARFTDSHFYWVEMMGRLRPGVSATQAQAELAGKFHGWVDSTANDKERATLPALWLQEGGSGVDSLRRQYSKPLYILMAMVGLILLIACANIANLLLARSVARRREMAVRLSLGAGRLRVVRQMLTESVLLALCGAAFGVFIGWFGIQSLTWLLANGRENFTLHAELDWRVLSFTVLVALVTGVLFGLAPAMQATRVDIAPALKESRAGASRGRTRLPFGLSHVLVVSQIAVSLLLVAAAGLFVRTLNNLHSVNLGFNQENILLFSMNASQAGYKGAALKNLYTELHARFRAIPEVRQSTFTDIPMVADWTSSRNVVIPGLPPQAREPNTAVMQVAPGFFEAMQIPILLGRSIDARDQEGAPLASVVNEVFAKKYFPGQSPVGLHFRIGKEKSELEIVGVSKTARYNSLKRDVPPVIYISFQQPVGRPLDQAFFELRTAGDPLALAGQVRRVAHDVSPNVPVADVTTQSRQIDATISQERTFAQLCTCFGALALVMACVGLYGTMAYAVTRRTSEIGIRMALGAARIRIVWMVLKQVFLLGAIGVTLGMAAVWETTTFLKSYLFGLQPNDPLTLFGSVAVLITCAVLAGYAPAFRASRIDPMVALRHE